MDGKITHLSLLAMLHGHPFPMTEAGLWVVTAIASRQAISADLLKEYRSHSDLKPPSAFVSNGGKPLEKGSAIRLRENGVGILPIRGPMIRHADLFDEISGAASMSSMAKDLGLALASPDVKSLVLDVESPGGEIPAELAEMVRQLDAQKPVTAYIGNWGMSAAYWTATGAGRVVAHRTAFLGSVGVRAVFYDTSKMEEALGVQKIEMMASQSPAKISDPATPEGKARIQAILDTTADDFIDYVSSNLKVSMKKVREEFGQGAAVDAKRAAEVGMIHGHDTMEGVIRSVGNGRRWRSTSASVGSSPPPGVSAMSKTFGEWFSSMWDKPIGPDSSASTAQEEAPAVPASPSVSRSGEDPNELRRQLDDANARIRAADDKALQTRVSGWVGKHIHPHQRDSVLAHARKLVDADRKLNHSAADSLLDHYCKQIEAQTLGLTTEAVVNNAPPPGGQVVTPAVSPDTPTAEDPWAEARKLVQADAEARRPRPADAAASSNGSHK